MRHVSASVAMTTSRNNIPAAAGITGGGVLCSPLLYVIQLRGFPDASRQALWQKVSRPPVYSGPLMVDLSKYIMLNG